MSDTPFRPQATAMTMPRRVAWALGAIGAGLVVIALWQPPVAGVSALAAIGVALVATAVLVRLLPAMRQRRARAEARHAARLLDLDFLPALLTDEQGIILGASALAQATLGAEAGLSVSQILADNRAAPGATFRRLREAALSGGAQQDILPGDPPLRVAVARIGGAGLIWRFEAGSLRQPAALADDIPSAILAPGGAITRANGALEALLGRVPLRIEDILADPPFRPDTVHMIRARGGPVAMRAPTLAMDDALRLCLFPAVAEDASIAPDLDAVPVPILRLSPTGAVLASNRLARGLLGANVLAGRSFCDLVEGMGRPVQEWLLDVAEGRGAIRPEVVRASLRQEETFLQITVRPIPDGADRALLAVLNDATELKTLERQFVQSQKMQAIGQLAGGIAHDFNNLLTAISGHCDLLLLRHDPGDPEYADLIQINQNANRAASLVGQLLAFSRKQTLELVPLDLRETLAEMAHLLNRLVGAQVRLRVTHDPDLPAIRADRRQLEQVVMNLVVNARDAMPHGGEIAIETRVRKLSTPLARDRVSVPPGDYVVVSVSDEGCGIAPDKLPKIFEPFFTTKRPGEGTGLGLSTAYGIVKQSGGYIFADSAVGSGTCFSLYFPAHHSLPAAETAGPPPASPPGIPPSVGTVLLVEDEAPVRAFAARALRLRGHKVIEVENAEEALATLGDPALQIDVFVSDVVMPGMDGPSWVREALRTRPGARVIFMSGYSEESVAKERLRIPNATFLPKPFSLAQLTEAVQAKLSP